MSMQKIIGGGYTIKLIRKVNCGVSSARNAGLDAATGDYIAFVDADDFVPENYFDALYKNMTDDVDMVRCESDLYLPNGEKINAHHKKLKSTIVLDASDRRNFEEYLNCTCWGVLYRNSVIGDLRFNERYYVGEDILFYYSALKKCGKIKHTISTAYCQVMTPGSAMRSTFSEKHYTEVYALQDLYRAYADNNGAREALGAKYMHRCYNILNEIRCYGINNALEKMKFLKREIRHYLLCGLRDQDCTKLRRAGLVLNALAPELICRHVMLLYYFFKNRHLYEQLRSNT